MPKAVVVEYDHDLSFIYKLKLARAGFDVRTAGDGQEGLEAAEAFRPDVILLDLNIPGMSGTEMLARLREQEWAADVRVVVLTNISKSEAPSSLRFLNVDRYLEKTHNTPAQVAEVVQEVLQSGVK